MAMNIRGGFQLTTFLLSILLATIPGFATHSSSPHIQQDPAGKECSHSGLPCSTALNPNSSKSQSLSTQHQLDQIERQSVNSIKSTTARANNKTSPNRSATVHSSARQSSINFAYHAP